MKTVGSFICGSIGGLIAFGLVVLIGITAGLPAGPGWWVIGLPFILWMGYLATIDR